jgi:integrase/recombinase XerC
MSGAPTVAEFAGTVRAVTPVASLLAWGYQLDRFVERHGSLRLDQVPPSLVAEFAASARRSALRRRGNQDGRSAEEHAITALRKLFATALLDGLIERNPAAAVPKPRRAPTGRHALSHDQVGQLFAAASDADTAILRFLLETACRREGLINLERRSLRPARQSVLLAEKGSRTREQPISRALLEYLDGGGCNLLMVTRRRLDGVWARVRRELPWAEELGVSSHWMRHTTISWVEEATSYSVAAAFAGHTPTSTTATYLQRSITDVATAFSIVFGEPHPLAEDRP